MDGFYIQGQGKAHNCCAPHEKVFNCKMFGTFNIQIPNSDITSFSPSITTEKADYRLLKIQKDSIIKYGWAIRDHKSHQPVTIYEVLTKELLPEDFKTGNLQVTVLQKWSGAQTKEWAKNQYWFQTFSFTPVKKADSKFLWDTINVINWQNQSVLDIGSHYGYFSFQASKAGARVVGVEPNDSSRNNAITIQENIIHSDVEFTKVFPENKRFDIILYLSVHHQIDPKYEMLKEQLEELKKIKKMYLFVELILPPMFPKGKTMSEATIDNIVGGKVLAKYQHTVRGTRKVYMVNV